FAAANLVFTGGHSLFEAKRKQHASVHPFPSSVDVGHFATARRDAGALGPSAPCLGFYGVIDERMDLPLLAAIADARPEWTIEMIGPVVKISHADLPQRANIHYLGPKLYDELPACASR